MMNIAQIFEEAALQWPERIAIIDRDGREYTFSELRKLVMQQAGEFKREGIAAGDRVMVFVPMSIELYISVLALFYLGAVAVFLDEWVNKERMELCCKIAGCKGFTASLKIRLFALFSKELRKIRHWFPLPKKNLRVTGKFSIYNSKPGDTALITFTTGSTGIPKAANRTHAFLKAQFDALMQLTAPLPGHPMGPDMPILPIVLLLNLGRGVTSVIADSKASKPRQFQPGKIRAQIQKHRVVSLTTSPYYAGRLTELPRNSVQLKRIIIGGAAVFPGLIEKLSQKLPDAETLIVYGSTEAEPVSHITGRELTKFHQGQSPALGLLVGYPDPEVKVVMLPLDYLTGQPFEPLTIPGQPGEICVSGAHVLEGYLDNPEAERRNKIWVNNTCWHRTGDAGYLDAVGRLFLLGRTKQIINYQGKVYYPFLIEYFMQNLPGIICGTVILKDENLLAIVQSQDGDRSAAEQAIQEYLPDATIINYKQIPLDPRHHAKIDYERLIGSLGNSR